MVRSCVYPGCKNREKRWSPYVFHRIPLIDIDLRMLWLAALKRDVNSPPAKLKQLRVCSKHFSEDDYIVTRMPNNRMRHMLKLNAVPKFQEPEGTEGESMEGVPEPGTSGASGTSGTSGASGASGTSVDVGEPELVPTASPRLSEHGEEDNFAASENEPESKETEPKEGEAASETTLSPEETISTVLVDGGEQGGTLESEREPKAEEESELNEPEVDTKEDTSEQQVNKSRLSSADDLDEMMDIGTVDQVEQEAQMKEEQQENSMDVECSRSPTTSTTASVAEDSNSVGEETDVKPTVLPAPAEEDMKVSLDVMQSGSSPSSEATASTGRDSSSPATVMNGMKVVKLSIPTFDNEIIQSDAQPMKSSPSPPMVTVKDEPIDEEYEQALISSTPTASVKDEPNTAKMFQDLDSDYDAGDLSEEEEDESDFLWVEENVSSSSGSDSEDMPMRKRKRQLSSETDHPDLLPVDADLPEPVPTGVLSPPFDPEAAVEEGRDGTVWTVLHPSKHPGRRQSQSVLTEAAGPTVHAKRSISDALSAFLCVFDIGMLLHITDCTVAEAHGQRDRSSWDLTVAELKAFIALLYVRGALAAKNMDLETLWSEKWGFPFFKETMARNRFREIKRFLRFDHKATRCARLQEDKFALISAVWTQFVQNSISCYKPGANITVGEQLFPTKTRCRFTQYMGNRPSKFGIKFWLAADVQSKYMLNGAPCLGKDETRSRGQLVRESLVLRLAEPFLGKGRNITTNSYFTSLKLATTLKAENTCLLGTMGKTKHELPPSAKERAELFSTKVLKCGDSTLTIYQEKPRKKVCVLSTAHTSVSITDGPKATPESVTYYNSTKDSVDVLDQMARKCSVKSSTGRWPLAVFYNILDLAGINAHILFKECTSSSIPRRKFILQLAEELRAEFMEEKRAQRLAQSLSQQEHCSPQSTPKRRQCRVRRNCAQNKTSHTCSKCQKPVCGNCTGRMEATCVDCEAFIAKQAIFL